MSELKGDLRDQRVQHLSFTDEDGKGYSDWMAYQMQPAGKRSISSLPDV